MVQDTPDTPPPRSNPREDITPGNTNASSATPDEATKAEVARIAKANLQNQLMKQRLGHRKWAAILVPGLPAIHLILNFALIIAQFCQFIELTEGILYYMGAATTGSFVLLGFFARGLFFETPSQPSK